MTEPADSGTLLDLLRALERSDNLKALARECGLTVRELRRRLGRWRRDLGAEEKGSAGAAKTGRSRKGARPVSNEWPELPAAADLDANPLPDRGSRILEIYTDGASKGNPGPAGIGIVFRQREGEALCTHAEDIGRATNNVAEYRAVLKALEFCRDWKVQKIHLYLDSELIARQLSGAYRVKSPDLLPLYQQVVHLSKGLKVFHVRHVPREKNGHADHMANVALAGRGKA